MEAGSTREEARDPTRSQVVLLLGFGARLALGLAITAVLGRALSPDAFGFFTLVGTTFLLAHFLFDFGTSAVVVRELALRPDRERTLLEVVLGWRRACALPISAAVLVWALLESDVHRRIVLVAVAASLPLLAPGALMSVFRVRQEQEGPELLRFLGQAAVLAGSLILIARGVPAPLFGLLLALQALATANGIGWLAARRLGYRPRARWRDGTLRPILSMAAVQAAVSLVQMAYFHVDVFLVVLLRGEEELGAYSAAFRPINSLLPLPGLLMFPLLPVLAALARADRGRLARLVRDATTPLLGIAALAAAAGGVLATDLVTLLYGGRYASGELSAAPALAWLALAFGLVLSMAIFNVTLLADGKERRLLRFALAGLAVNVAGNLVLLPAWGFTAAAFVTALTHAVVGAAAAASLWRLPAPGGRLLSAAQLPALLPGVGLGLILWQTPGSPAQRVALGSVLGVAGVVALLALPAARRFRLALRQPTWAEADPTAPGPGP